MAESFAGTTINSRELAEFVRSAPGLFRLMSETGEAVKVEAQARVGVYVVPPAGPTRTRRPGTLRDSIVKRITSIGGMPTVLVGSDDPIALIHHEGTEAHTITAGHGLLVFYSTRAGRVIFTKTVNHPGTKPNRYLTDSLEVIAAIHRE